MLETYLNSFETISDAKDWFILFRKI